METINTEDNTESPSVKQSGGNTETFVDTLVLISDMNRDILKNIDLDNDDSDDD